MECESWSDNKQYALHVANQCQIPSTLYDTTQEPTGVAQNKRKIKYEMWVPQEGEKVEDRGYSVACWNDTQSRIKEALRS